MDKRQQELSNYRLEQAERCVKSAKILAADNDYDDYYILSKDDVEKQIENAQKFYVIKHIKSELMRIMGNDRAQEIISR